MIEIERKFLVTNLDFKSEAYKSTRIIQGFLNTHKARTVRIRLKEDIGYITVKGISTEDGLQRFEWEKEITIAEAQALLKLCEQGVIDKIRYEVKIGSHIFEVDEFLGDNLGLIVAEIELKHVSETFVKPLWLGQEVTGIVKYYNTQLSLTPYNQWIK